MIDNSDNNLYTTQQVEDIAQRAAQYAVQQAFHDAHLENSISGMAISQNNEEVNDMAYERRQVIINHNDDGSPIFKNLRASSQDEMNIKIVKAFIDSGRIWEYLPSNFTKSKRPNVTVGEYSEEWLQRKRKVKQTTLVSYKLYVHSYIVPFLGKRRVIDVTPNDVQALLDKNKEKAKKTLIEVKATLTQIMDYAINDKIIEDNPCKDKDIDIPSDTETVRDALPIDQFNDIIEHLGDLLPEDRVFLATYMYTGVRRGEGIALCWDDIDFDKKEIHIIRNATFPGTNVATITTPKTNAGKRVIPLDPNLESILAPHRSSGYVFSGEKPLTITGIKSIMRRINRTIDLHGATLHILRHSFITYLVGETTDYKTVQGISGHADVFTLMNRYAHKQDYKIKDLFQKLHNNLSGSGTENVAEAIGK